MLQRPSQYTVILIPDQDPARWGVKAHAQGPAATGYTVIVPALPGCITEGDTHEEALENAKDAIKLYLEDLEAHGEPIPPDVQPLRTELVLIG